VVVDPARDRKPALLAVSISRLRRLFEETAPAYADAACIRILDRGFDDAVAEIRRRARSERIDAIVAAGANGAYLRQHLALPVALVKVTGFDLLQALAKARAMTDRIGIVTHRDATPDLRAVEPVLSVALVQRAYVTADDARHCVRELVDRGVRAIVGPGMITELAEQAGATGVFLYSQDSVRQALADAIESVRVARIEETRREELDTLLRHLNEAVLAVDPEERVRSLNPAMAQLLGIEREEAIGRPLHEVADGLSVRRVLDGGAAELEAIERIAGRTLVVNRIPVLQHGQQTGAVITLQDASTIERVDRSLRSRRKRRGFLARHELADMRGESPAMREALALAGRYARTESTVLVTGESGTGKELLAQGIHNASRRRGSPFVAINCGAFPEPLLESEFFGHEEGAFTGARRGGRAGLFELAHTGTLFLDEIADMPQSLQTRLLRVLQEKEVLRLGGVDPTPVDVRLVAATNRPVEQAVAAGRFRADLFYRLNILRIDLPALRDRGADVVLLAAPMLERSLRALRCATPAAEILRAVSPALRRHVWPGNVRELENVCERVAVYAAGQEPGEIPDLAALAAIAPEVFAPRAAANGIVPGTQSHASLRAAKRDAELEHIAATVHACRGNVAEACRRLGIGRTTLWRKLREAERRQERAPP
jgi:propionate catabolism operon transcriptional regulator